MTSLLWLRNDLRRGDHPALAAAARSGPVSVCFVLDPAIFSSSATVSAGWLAATLRALDDDFDGGLCLRIGDPAVVIPELAASIGANQVVVSAETEPAALARDAAVRKALIERGIAWIEKGSGYAVAPGQVTTRESGGFQVFTAFFKAWLAHGWPRPTAEPASLRLARVPSEPAAWAQLAQAEAACPVPLPPPGEQAGLARWTQFCRTDLADYAVDRDRPDLDRTSRLSPYLKLGVLHPRTLLADLATHPGVGPQRFVAELAWREFYADILARNPASLESDLKQLPLAYDPAGPSFEAWQDGRTGYPIVDAGQRQLLATGWMPNRVRMITASFLTKDLHLWWRLGAGHFAEWLLDADPASNVGSWQWAAGTGTDAAPYFRVFNPTLQGERFDPNGDYVRRWVPELRHLDGPAVHRLDRHRDGYPRGYPLPIIDHSTERLEALARYRLARR
jgi:deoxyribodipyrimidine photo-lyase